MSAVKRRGSRINRGAEDFFSTDASGVVTGIRSGNGQTFLLNGTLPDLPTVAAHPNIGTAVSGDGYVDVVFTAGTAGSSATVSYTAVLSTGESATGTASPIRVPCSNGKARTAFVVANNSAGPSLPSTSSNPVLPVSSEVLPQLATQYINGNPVFA